MKRIFTFLSLFLALSTYAQTGVRITEINYNGPESGTDTTEFIEIYNPTSAAINLNGYQFTSGVVYTFPNISIPSMGFVVVGMDSVAMLNVFGVASYQWTSGGLSNGGEPIALKDANGVLVDSLRYDDVSPWPTKPDGDGPTLVLCDLQADQKLGTSWDTSSTATGVIVNGKAVFGSPGALDASCNSTPPTPTNPVYDISVINNTDANGVADSIGVYCWTKGLVLGVDMRGGNGIQFTLFDGEGIGVFNFSDVNNYVVTEGDSIMIRGTVGQFNGLTQLGSIDSISVLNTGNSIPSATVVTSLTEAMESTLVKFENAYVNSISGSNYSLVSGTDTITMRIDSDTDVLDSLTIAIGDSLCSITGTVGQFDSSNPYTSGYQLFPRTYMDVDTMCGITPVVTSNDSIKPEVVDGDFNSATSVTVVFSEPVDAASATDVNNYSLAPGITISSAVQSSSLDSVTLTLSPALTHATQYTVNIMNVADTSANANVMDPFTTSFWFNSYSGTDLIVSEIMYAQDGSGVQDIDYFEVHNLGSSNIFLGGMDVVKGMDLSIDSNLTLAAGDYFVFTENIDSFMLAFPTVTNVMGVDNGSLSGGGEEIEIANTLNQVVTSVDYGTSSPWPAYSDMESIELCDVTTDYTDAANWYYAGTVSSTVANTIYGTPGAANSCAAKPIIPTYDIEVIRTVDANGEPDSMGVYCAIEGIVHGVDLDGNAGYLFVVIDDTRGVHIHSFVDVDNYVVNQGDELRLVGSVQFYNGLTQFRPDSITILSTGHCIDYPEWTDYLDEDTESEAIQMLQVMVADASQWPTPGNNANVDIVTMDGDTLTMRLDRDTKIQDTILNAPSGFFNLSGFGGQFDSSSPYDEGYQILPHFVSDIDTVPSTISNVFVNEVMVQNQTVIADPQGDYDSWIEIYNANSTPVDLTGTYIGTEEPYKFSRCASPVIVPANGFLMLWADDEMEDGAEHLPFELMDEDFLGFATKDLAILDTLEWDSALADVSLGRSVDGAGTWVSFEVSTPNATNAGGVVLSVINTVASNPLNVYPNPATDGNINFNKVVSFTMYSITGQTIMVQNNINRLDVSNLDNGVYIIETTEGEIVKVMIK